MGQKEAKLRTRPDIPIRMDLRDWLLLTLTAAVAIVICTIIGGC
jgi:hypothetical protein